MSDYIPRTIAFQEGERNLFFHLLTACNLSCSHCYINPEQHGRATLDRKTIFSWLDLFSRKDQSTNLILLGGEPTLHPDLPEIIAYAKQANYAVTVDSNGCFDASLLVKTSPSQLDYLSFSLDGPTPEVNDPIRGEAVFVRCTENIKKAVALGYRTSLIYTVSAKNIDYLSEMPALLEELGVERFFIQVIGLRGNSAEGGDALQVDQQHWFSVVPGVAQDAAARGIHVTWPRVYLNPDESFSCAGKVSENYFVFPNGRVYQCPLCEDHPLHSFEIKAGELVSTSGLSENNFFDLQIPEGCVMNKLLQPGNLQYNDEGEVMQRISCCMLKQEISPL